MEGLSELATMYPNVKILHFEVDLRNDRLDFKFRLKDGIRRVPHYGLLLARVAGLPASVIDTATSITSQITQQVTWYLLLAITRLCHHLLGLYMLRRM